MAHGGARNGAGRRKAVDSGKKPPAREGKARKTEKRVEIAVAAINDGKITPLEVLLQTMREAWNTPDRSAKDTALACAIARDAAPYVHPKLANTTLAGDKDRPLHMMAGILDGIAGTSRGIPGRREEGDEEPGKPALAS